MSTQVVDYGTLTDLELTKEVARRLGYKVIQFGERYIRWLIETPEGKYWNDDYGHENTAYEVLGFATDANVALALIAEYGYTLEYDPESGASVKLDFDIAPVGKDKEVARAASIAFLKWQDAKK